MALLILLLLIVVAGVAATTRAILRDDRGQLPAPGSHRPDPSMVPPATRLSR